MNLISMLSFGLEISDTKGISSFLQYCFECNISNIKFSRGALLSTARPDILTVVIQKIQVFQDVTPCHQVNIYQYITGLYCFHLPDWEVQKEWIA
jgi:hypothetical protein